jgi:hypothetical protein
MAPRSITTQLTQQKMAGWRTGPKDRRSTALVQGGEPYTEVQVGGELIEVG